MEDDQKQDPRQNSLQLCTIMKAGGGACYMLRYCQVPVARHLWDAGEKEAVAQLILATGLIMIVSIWHNMKLTNENPPLDFNPHGHFPLT